MVGPAEFVQGKLFIGLVLNVLLFGINVTQTYIYYIHSKKDPLWIKISVVILLVADFLQPTFLSIYLYQTLIVQFGNETALSTATNLFAVVPTMTCLTASIVQIFFAWRIRILTNNWYYVAFVVAAAASGGAFSIAIAYVGRFNPQFVEFRNMKVVVILSFVSEMLGDFMITSIMVWFLWCVIMDSNLDVDSQMHKSGLRQSNKMVDRIICFTLQTGLLTLICAGLGLLFYLMIPDGTYLLLNLIRSKMYTTSLLSSLNSRQGWGFDTSENNDEDSELSTDLGLDLRFASNFQSTADRTSVVPSENELDLEKWNEVKDNSGADLEASVTHGQQVLTN